MVVLERITQFETLGELLDNKKDINNLLKSLESNQNYKKISGYYQLQYDNELYNLIFLGDNGYPVQVYYKKTGITCNTNDLELLKRII